MLLIYKLFFSSSYTPHVFTRWIDRKIGILFNWSFCIHFDNRSNQDLKDSKLTTTLLFRLCASRKLLLFIIRVVTWLTWYPKIWILLVHVSIRYHSSSPRLSSYWLCLCYCLWWLAGRFCWEFPTSCSVHFYAVGWGKCTKKCTSALRFSVTSGSPCWARLFVV